MNVVLFILIIILFYKSKIYIMKTNNDYLSKENTKSINGIFVIIVFYSHLVTYVSPIYSKDFLMLNLRNYLNQLMVTSFLLFSGFGVYESIKKQKNKYIDSIPQKRIFTTWLKFAVAICLFIPLNLYLKNYYSYKNIILSFLSWDTIGNSNWYIFSILVMYSLTFFSFKIIKKNNLSALMINLILSIIYVVVLRNFKEPYWYNTVLCYNLGMFVSHFYTNIKSFLSKNINYMFILLTSVILFIFLRRYMYYDIGFEIYSISFVVLLLILSYRIKIENKILIWLGNKVFWIYILQRLPMIYFSNTELINHTYRFTLVSFATTITLSVILDYVFNTILKRIKFSNK